MYKKLTPNLMVEDVYHTLNYYCSILGFEMIMAIVHGSEEVVTEVGDEQPLEFAMVKAGDVEIMLQQTNSIAADVPPLKGKAVGASMTLYIELDQVDSHYASLKEKVDVITAPETKFYGMREWYLHDCNGYIICFAEDALKRGE